MSIKFELSALSSFRKYIVSSTLPGVKIAHLYIGHLKFDHMQCHHPITELQDVSMEQMQRV